MSSRNTRWKLRGVAILLAISKIEDSMKSYMTSHKYL